MTKTDTLRGRFEAKATKLYYEWMKKQPTTMSHTGMPVLIDCAPLTFFIAGMQSAQPTEAEIEELARELARLADTGVLYYPEIAALLRGKLGGTR